MTFFIFLPLLGFYFSRAQAILLLLSLEGLFVLSLFSFFLHNLPSPENLPLFMWMMTIAVVGATIGLSLFLFLFRFFPSDSLGIMSFKN